VLERLGDVPLLGEQTLVLVGGDLEPAGELLGVPAAIVNTKPATAMIQGKSSGSAPASEPRAFITSVTAASPNGTLTDAVWPLSGGLFRSVTSRSGACAPRPRYSA
jgi:hypothetical protein